MAGTGVLGSLCLGKREGGRPVGAVPLGRPPSVEVAATCFPASAVSSARRGLTSLFGMGRGGAPGLLPP